MTIVIVLKWRKKETEEIRQQSMESEAETRLGDQSPMNKRILGSGYETIIFLAKKAESYAKFSREKLRLKSEELNQKEKRQEQF